MSINLYTLSRLLLLTPLLEYLRHNLILQRLRRHLPFMLIIFRQRLEEQQPRRQIHILSAPDFGTFHNLPANPNATSENDNAVVKDKRCDFPVSMHKDGVALNPARVQGMSARGRKKGLTA